jgi:hypothetical protein
MLLNKYRKIQNVLAVLLILCGLLINAQSTYASDYVSNRTLQLSSSNSGGVSNYLVSFILNNLTTPLAAIQIQFCANSPIITDPCVLPVGMNTSVAVLNSQVGNGGFILDDSTNDVLLLNRNAAIPVSGLNYYQFEFITNPASPGQYYARVKTFATADTGAPEIEHGGFAFDITPNLLINTQVPPYILFCLATTIPELDCNNTSGDSLNLGDFQTYSSNSGTYQFLIATNSGTGYSVSVYGNTLTSGNYTIPALTTPSSPQYGVSQFGLNLVANTQPNVGMSPVGDPSSLPTSNYGISNEFMFANGDVLAADSHQNSYTRFTNSVMVNISKSQPAGFYSTTLTYIAVANF